jgi:hypothetical protein
MSHWDFETIRPYISPVALTIVALFGIVKDSKEFKERAREPGLTKWRRLYRGQIPNLLYDFTLLLLVLGISDTSATQREAAEAKAGKAKSDQQTTTLQEAVNTGNKLLTQQRQDFLQQFNMLSGRVGDLQTQVKTADLQQQVAQLNDQIAAERKSIEGEKTKLSFTLLDTNGSDARSVMLQMHDGSVHVRLTVLNDTDVTALEGTIVLTVCDKCEIVGNPAGFTKVAGSPDTRRNMDFQHVFAKSRLPVMEVDVKPPPKATKFDIGIEYRCRNCENYAYLQNLQAIGTTTLPTELMGTVFVLGNYQP